MVGIESSSTFNVNKYDSVSNSDEKPGRFFKDQPDVNDDYQIHFNYLLAKDSEDREWDINGKMEEILLEVNESMAKATSEHKFGDGIEKKYITEFINKVRYLASRFTKHLSSRQKLNAANDNPLGIKNPEKKVSKSA